MTTCQGCGGVLGRDCWNQEDCVNISWSIRNDAQYDEYENIMSKPLHKVLWIWVKFRLEKYKKPRPIDDSDIPF